MTQPELLEPHPVLANGWGSRAKRGVIVRKREACMAITLVNPQTPQEAGSYLWCTLEVGGAGHMHLSHCGMWWDTSDLVEPTENMRLWRTGNPFTVKRVSGRMLG